MGPLTTDVLVIGGGPAGASTAIRLANAGHHVTVVEKRATPRHKACGDSLSPRALAELDRLDVDPVELGGHAVAGVSMTAGTRRVEVPWPAHPDYPAHSVVLRRQVLDEHLRQRAREAGATVLMGHEATAPLSERGFVRGATLQVTGDGNTSPATEEINARFMVVADGANSRFGRKLGTQREPRWPYAVATRTYFESPRHDARWMEAALGLPGPDGRPVTGYGWVMPVGDGTVNVGIGVLSTYRDIKGVNALKLLDGYSERLASSWGIEPTAPLKAPTRFRLPLGGSVGPKMGPTFLVVGDAAGAANPLNGDGVDAALMGARLAAGVLDEALTTGNSTSLQRYPLLIADEVGRYRKVGRLSARFLGRPRVLDAAMRLGFRSETAMGAVLRIAGNELRSEGRGGAERAYRLASLTSRFAPNW